MGNFNIKHIKLLIYALIVLALVGFWFLCIDLTFYVETCKTCLYRRDIIQVRIFTIPVHTTVRESESLAAYVAERLGVPCPHTEVERWRRQKWWGLLICFCPCHRSLYGFVGYQHEHDEVINKKINELLKLDPNLPVEFRERVLQQHDLVYWRELYRKILPKEPLGEQTE